MSRPLLTEKYQKGNDVINYVVYESTTLAGKDEVLQHKLFGTTETAHITLHPNGVAYFRPARPELSSHLKMAVKNQMAGYSPPPSDAVKAFLRKANSQLIEE